MSSQLESAGEIVDFTLSETRKVRVDFLSLDTIRDYLEANGWENTFTRQYVQVFRKDGLEIQLPTTDDLADFGRAMQKVFDELAEDEKRPPSHIAAAMGNLLSVEMLHIRPHRPSG